MRTEVNQTDILCVLRQRMSSARACQKLKKKSLILWAASLPVDLSYVDSLLTGVLELHDLTEAATNGDPMHQKS
jgi:hypothetical protein